MRDELRNKLRALSDLKYCAFKLGRKDGEVKDVRALIAHTDANSGDIAEIVMAFMLGAFTKLFKGVRVDMTSYLDSRGVDFLLTRFDYKHKVQMKFNKKNDRDYGDDIAVVEIGAPPKFDGTFHIDKRRGDWAVFDFLIGSNAFDEAELYDFIEEHSDFCQLCVEAWNIIKN